MSDQQLIRLLEKYLEGDCTAEERAAMESWYDRFKSSKASDEGAQLPDLMQVYNDITDKLKKEGEWQEAPGEPVVHNIKRGWWRAAAAIVILLTGAGVWMMLARPAKQLVLDTPSGVRKKILLEDGTRVWLNVSSELTYPADIATRKREVYLKGEAYFEVAKKDAHPFIIHTADMSVKVLGTRFNVKAYQGDATIETTLLEGKVAVGMNKQPDKNLLLAPGEKLTLKRKDKTATDPATAGRIIDWGEFLAIVQPVKPQVPAETVWMDNRLEFKDKSFQELVKLMSRWYGKKIVLQDSTLNDNIFTGTFKRETVEEVLKVMQLTADFKYTIKGDTIYIHN
ncbi:FecR domain-containing protein [Chitinophaga sp. MM2321]|uniref:FecR family protein n=1 Tax=Chitinophaga sp. MM2321 TaxID=3137178 RepID=UPI0032D579BF